MRINKYIQLSHSLSQLLLLGKKLIISTERPTKEGRKERSVVFVVVVVVAVAIAQCLCKKNTHKRGKIVVGAAAAEEERGEETYCVFATRLSANTNTVPYRVLKQMSLSIG